MSQTDVPPLSGRTARILHRALLGGQLVVATVFGLLNRTEGPLLDGEPGSLIAPALAGVAAVLLGVVVLVLVPRAAVRPSHLSPDEYWATERTRPLVLLAWFLTEGAAMLALVGVLLTGAAATAAVAAAAVATFIWLRPSRFDGG